MDKLNIYKQNVEKIINDRSDYKSSFGEIEVQTIFDRENNHYELVNLGWNGHKRIRGCLLHLDIKDGKIWIQHDGTEDGVANDLVELGVPKEDIVLAFHPPYKRKYTGFGE
jgi:intein-encoded DNA endonuclease-like protein